MFRQTPLAFPVRRELQLAHWGFVPGWHVGELSPVASVGIERVSRNGLFRDAAQSRRCLVPMSGYFEWRPFRSGIVPYYVHGSEPIVAALGIYNVTTIGRRSQISVAVLTRDTVNSARRVPALLHREDWDSWLGPEGVSKETDYFVDQSSTTKQLTDELVRYPVSERIGGANPRNVESLIAPVGADD